LRQSALLGILGIFLLTVRRGAQSFFLMTFLGLALVVFILWLLGL
jgi:hypothetical protein